jgi:hypothetical protein
VIASLFHYKLACVGILSGARTQISASMCMIQRDLVQRERAKYVYRVGRCDVLPEDGTPVPKHAGATLIMNCDLCLYFNVLDQVHLLVNILNIRKCTVGVT